MIEKVIDKLCSGRFCLTIMVGLSVCYGFIVKLISAEAFLPLAMIVWKEYFDRKDRHGTG